MVARRPDEAAERWRVPVGPDSGLPAGYQAIDAVHLAHRWDPADLARGSFEFLNERRDLGEPAAWDPADATQLWLFHLHYWEWAWSLAAAGDDEARATFARHRASWSRATTFGRWNAWAPYPASLRAWVLVNVHATLAAGTDGHEPLVADIARHAGFIGHNLELDIGGNHLVKNIKGLLGCAVFLHHQPSVDVALRRLERELAVQVLADGGHYELSPSYHCQVLADLLDMARLLEAAGHAPLPALDDAVGRMRTWLGEMVLPDATLPLFNDCEPVDPALLALLDPTSPPDRPLAVLAHSGYVVVRSGPFHLVADVGQPGPASPPGHIHADCLGFTLHVHGEPAVVDTGTSEYGSGPRRGHERSTAAHNTVEVDGIDQTEVFGAFRAGRRARTTLERAEVRDDGSVTVTASHDGYRHLPGRPVHRRTWTVTPDTVQLLDHIQGDGRHQVTGRLHLPGEPGGEPVDAPGGTDGYRTGPLTIGHQIRTPDDAEPVDRRPTVEPCLLAAGFGVLVPGTEVAVHANTPLPVILVTRLGVEAQQQS
jgi:uncharacterized heparinase superfamily protein